jgi:hypothetical protein
VSCFLGKATSHNPRIAEKRLFLKPVPVDKMFHIMILWYNMIQTEAAKARSRHLAASFPRLGDQDQAYLETLTAQLAGIHETSPESQAVTGKKAKTIVQQNKGQEP